MKYSSIVFMSGDDADEAIRLWRDCKISDCLEYLLMWDNGEYYDTTDNEPWGKVDNISIQGEYIIAVNEALNYISLTKEISEEE